MVTKMQPRIYMPAEHIIEKDQLPESMYVIRRGLVGRLGRVLSAAHTAIFGEDCVLYRYRLRRHYAAVSLTYVEAFGMTIHDVNAAMPAGESAF